MSATSHKPSSEPFGVAGEIISSERRNRIFLEGSWEEIGVWLKGGDCVQLETNLSNKCDDRERRPGRNKELVVKAERKAGANFSI